MASIPARSPGGTDVNFNERLDAEPAGEAPQARTGQGASPDDEQPRFRQELVSRGMAAMTSWCPL